MTTLHLRDDLKLRTCSLDGLCPPGGVITSQTTLCRNLRGKEGGGLILEGGVLAGHYGMYACVSHA